MGRVLDHRASFRIIIIIIIIIIKWVGVMKKRERTKNNDVKAGQEMMFEISAI